MNIKRARKIDYYLGKAICLVLSFIEYFKSILFPRKRNNFIPKRVVFLELSEIGSAILAYPAIKKFKERYPNTEIYFWTFKENSEVLSLLNFIPPENIILMRSKNIFTIFLDTFKNLKILRKEKIDTIIDLELFSRFSSIVSYLSRANSRVGFSRYSMEGLYRGALHTHKVQYNPYFHISKNFAFLIDALSAEFNTAFPVKNSINQEDFTLPKIITEKEEFEKLDKRLLKENKNFSKNSKIVLMNLDPDDKIGIRNWPKSCYLKLTEKILKDESTFVIFIGKYNGNGQSLFSHQRYIDLRGKSSLRDLVNLFNLSNILITHDSGIMHLASLTNIHIIALFGPETPDLYKPLTDNKTVFYNRLACSPCLSAYNHRESLCRDNKCLKTIGPDDLYQCFLNL